MHNRWQGEGLGHRIGVAWVGCVVLAALAGCQPPTAAIRHDMPPVTPVDPRTTRIEVGEVSVSGIEAPSLAGAVGQALHSRLPSSPAAAEGTVTMDSDVSVSVEDRTGQRTIRTGRPGALTETRVDWLVREVEVAMTCRLTPHGASEPVAILEQRRRYTSLADPNARGEFGLSRPDDPQRVPAAELIAVDLARQCARAAADMLTPPDAIAEVQLRSGRPADRAIAEGRYADAVAALQPAHRRRPGDRRLRFDLAVALEGAGSLQAALGHYEALAGPKGQDDPEAYQAARRVRSILERRAQPVGGAGEPGSR